MRLARIFYVDPSSAFSSLQPTNVEKSNVHRSVVRFLRNTPRDLSSRAIVGGAKFDKRNEFSPKQLTFFLARGGDPVVEMDDGSLEQIEVVRDSSPVSFGLKRMRCDKNCRMCELKGKCIKSTES